jgi:hypothetical protein
VTDVVAPFEGDNDGPGGFVITLLPSFTVTQTQLAFGSWPNDNRGAVAGLIGVRARQMRGQRDVTPRGNAPDAGQRHIDEVVVRASRRRPSTR